MNSYSLEDLNFRHAGKTWSNQPFNFLDHVEIQRTDTNKTHLIHLAYTLKRSYLRAGATYFMDFASSKQGQQQKKVFCFFIKILEKLAYFGTISTKKKQAKWSAGSCMSVYIEMVTSHDNDEKVIAYRFHAFYCRPVNKTVNATLHAVAEILEENKLLAEEKRREKLHYEEYQDVYAVDKYLKDICDVYNQNHKCSCTREKILLNKFQIYLDQERVVFPSYDPRNVFVLASIDENRGITQNHNFIVEGANKDQNYIGNYMKCPDLPAGEDEVLETVALVKYIFPHPHKLYKMYLPSDIQLSNFAQKYLVDYYFYQICNPTIIELKMVNIGTQSNQQNVVVLSGSESDTESVSETEGARNINAFSTMMGAQRRVQREERYMEAQQREIDEDNEYAQSRAQNTSFTHSTTQLEHDDEEEDLNESMANDYGNDAVNDAYESEGIDNSEQMNNSFGHHMAFDAANENHASEDDVVRNLRQMNNSIPGAQPAEEEALRDPRLTRVSRPGDQNNKLYLIGLKRSNLSKIYHLLFQKEQFFEEEKHETLQTTYKSLFPEIEYSSDYERWVTNAKKAYKSGFDNFFLIKHADLVRFKSKFKDNLYYYKMLHGNDPALRITNGADAVPVDNEDRGQRQLLDLQDYIFIENSAFLANNFNSSCNDDNIGDTVASILKDVLKNKSTIDDLDVIKLQWQQHLQLLKTGYLETRRNMVEEFERRTWSSKDANISKIGNKILNYYLTTGRYYRSSHCKSDYTMSIFANRIIKLLNWYDNALFVCNTHKELLLLNHSKYDAYRQELNLHFNQIYTGESATSKSFNFEKMEQLSIMNTVTTLTYQTTRADAIDGDDNDNITVFNEAPPGLFMSNKTNDPSALAAEAAFKEKLTSQTTTCKEFVRNLIDGSRENRISHSQSIGVYCGATNDKSIDCKEAMRTRFYWGTFNRYETSKKSIGLSMQKERDAKSNAKIQSVIQECTEYHHVEQARVFLVFKYIYMGLLAEPSMDCADLVFNRVTKQLKQKYNLSMPARTKERYISLCKIYTIVNALEIIFNDEDGMHAVKSERKSYKVKDENDNIISDKDHLTFEEWVKKYSSEKYTDKYGTVTFSCSNPVEYMLRENIDIQKDTIKCASFWKRLKNNGCNKDFFLYDLLDIEPYLYCTEEIAFFAMTQIQEECYNPAEFKVAQALYKVHIQNTKQMSYAVKDNNNYDFGYASFNGKLKSILMNIQSAMDVSCGQMSLHNIQAVLYNWRDRQMDVPEYYGRAKHVANNAFKVTPKFPSDCYARWNQHDNFTGDKFKMELAEMNAQGKPQRALTQSQTYPPGFYPAVKSMNIEDQNTYKVTVTDTGSVLPPASDAALNTMKANALKKTKKALLRIGDNKLLVHMHVFDSVRYGEYADPVKLAIQEVMNTQITKSAKYILGFCEKDKRGIISYPNILDIVRMKKNGAKKFKYHNSSYISNHERKINKTIMNTRVETNFGPNVECENAQFLEIKEFLNYHCCMKHLKKLPYCYDLEKAMVKSVDYESNCGLARNEMEKKVLLHMLMKKQYDNSKIIYGKISNKQSFMKYIQRLDMEEKKKQAFKKKIEDNIFYPEEAKRESDFVGNVVHVLNEEFSEENLRNTLFGSVVEVPEFDEDEDTTSTAVNMMSDYGQEDCMPDYENEGRPSKRPRT